MPKYTQEEFDSELRKMLQEARSEGQQRCRIVVKDLHDRVVRKPRTNRMRMACEGMWKLWKEQGSYEDNIIHLAPSNKSSRNIIEFDTDLNKKLDQKSGSSKMLSLALEEPTKEKIAVTFFTQNMNFSISSKTSTVLHNEAHILSQAYCITFIQESLYITDSEGISSRKTFKPHQIML